MKQLTLLILPAIIIGSLLFSIHAIAQEKKYGIKVQQAPEWHVDEWIDEQGNEAHYRLQDFRGKLIVLFCFQSWCPGCQKSGFPPCRN